MPITARDKYKASQEARFDQKVSLEAQARINDQVKQAAEVVTQRDDDFDAVVDEHGPFFDLRDDGKHAVRIFSTPKGYVEEELNSLDEPIEEDGGGDGTPTPDPAPDPAPDPTPDDAPPDDGGTPPDDSPSPAPLP